jgi:hypothetical protein
MTKAFTGDVSLRCSPVGVFWHPTRGDCYLSRIIPNWNMFELVPSNRFIVGVGWALYHAIGHLANLVSQ